MSITISVRTVRTLESIEKDLTKNACESGFCHGPGRLISMATCHRCWGVNRLRAVIRNMKKKIP